MWILGLLLERPQRVRVNVCLSDTVCMSTGSPQGCVLSPLLFILYANDCRSCRENLFFVKFSDDTAYGAGSFFLACEDFEKCSTIHSPPALFFFFFSGYKFARANFAP